MAFWNGWTINRQNAQSNNYKLQLFETISKQTEVSNYSAIKKYFNKVYNSSDSSYQFDAFGVNETAQKQLYVGQQTNKANRLLNYRSMALCPQIAQAIDTICYAADVPDENNNIVKVQIKDKNLQPKEVEILRQACQQYLDLFDFDNNLIQYFRKLVIQGQICWENIVAKDDLEQGIININIIPNQAYQFCYDVKLRKKMGIMITNTAVEMYNIAGQAISNIPGQGPINIGGQNLNCFEQLQDDSVIVLPFQQLTYIDSGIYTADNKAIFSPLERARRSYNQLMLIEDAILIYRMVRAPQKYVFNVDIGRMGAAKGQQKVAQLMKQFSTKKTYDPATGTIGKVYDPMQMTQSFWFTKGADSQGIQVNTLTSQHNFGNLDDLQYFLKKLYRALNIPISRIFEANTEIKVGNADGTPSAQQLNFAKFIMSLQKRFALGLLNGLTLHLKLKGLWDLYKLTRSKIDIIFTPPIEYQQFRRTKLLQSKINMLKIAVGDQTASKLFSARYALKHFLGLDDDAIDENNRLKFKQQIQQAKMEGIIEAVKKSGTIDLKGEGSRFDKSLKQILQDGLINDSSSDSEGDGDGEDGGDDDGFGGDDSGGDDGGF